MSDHLIWLSFVGDAGFLGAAIVSVSDDDIAAVKPIIDRHFPNHVAGAECVTAARMKALLTGCHPGGEMGAVELPPHIIPPDMPLHRLMQKPELARRGLI